MEDKNNQVTNESELGVMSILDKNQQRTIIKTIGVGGGGVNAVNLMYHNINGVTFAVIDSDRQQLIDSPVPNRVFLRPDTTHRSAAEESESEIAAFFDDDTKMAIIVAGMGGDTGTDAAPVIARIAHEECLLTVGIVTIPFQFEGTQKIQKALEGIQEMSKYVDALFVINNEHLTEINNDLNPFNAFMKADETLTTAVRSLCDLITVKNLICIDFNDVKWTLRKSGSAMFISGYASGERRVTKAIENALESPLLKDCNIFSAKKMMMNFYFNPYSESPLRMDEMSEIQEFMANFDQETDVIWGISYDTTLDDQIKVTVLASGFNVSYKSQIPLGLINKS